MNNNTERLAREWAEKIKAIPRADRRTDVTAAMEYILANTTPPTMADVEWDDDEHHLAGATTHTGFDVVMMRYDVDIDLIVTDEGNLPCSWLTPNGKRYELREIKEPEHPEMLTTVEDYENAPSGTIVASNICPPYMKYELDSWTDNFGTTVSDEELVGGPTTVLRWGWYA